MNYKLLFPTYRNRYLFIEESLKEFSGETGFEKALNLGTGEGDYDRMIASFCKELIACDINERDVNFARQLNRGVANIKYEVQNALQLTFPNDTFDLLISVDVIEHVGRPEQMIRELGRVLKPGGIALITFPSLDFPLTYDPVNRILSYFSKTKIPQGAYAFGHEYLIATAPFLNWSADNGLRPLKEKNLSGYIVGFLEMYWTGFIQRIFKANAANLPDQKEKKMALRPSGKEPLLIWVTDAVIGLDQALFKNTAYSVGKGFVLQKKEVE